MAFTWIHLFSALHGKREILTAYRLRGYKLLALFTLQSYIYSKITEANAEGKNALKHLQKKKKKKRKAHPVIVSEHQWHFCGTGQAGNDTPRKPFQSYTRMIVNRLCSKLRLIRNDLFSGTASDCTIMSRWREKKMYNALSPLLSRGWEEGQVLWDIQVLVMDLCISVFVWARRTNVCVWVHACKCFSVFVWNLLYICVQREKRVWPLLVRDLTLRNMRKRDHPSCRHRFCFLDTAMLV